MSATYSKIRKKVLALQFEYAERGNEYGILYIFLACFVNLLALNMYESMSYTGVPRRNTLFIFVGLRDRNT